MPEAARETKLLAAYAVQHPQENPTPQRGRKRARIARDADRAHPSGCACSQASRLDRCRISGVLDKRTNSASRRAWPSALSLLGASIAMATACSTAPVSSGPLFGTGVLHPPPKPGDSISHTRMCECKACNPDACCDGPEDDAPAQSCGDSYDFSNNPGCGGLAVRSCASRCTRQVWRVHSGESCSAKRPLGCCQAG